MDLDAFLILNGGNIQIQERSGKLTISKHKKKEERKREFHSLDEVGVDGFKIAPRGILIKRVLKKTHVATLSKSGLGAKRWVVVVEKQIETVE